MEHLKLFFIGLIIMALGSVALAIKWLIPGAHLPFWPFDGILSIIGGAFVSYFALRSATEVEEQDDAGPAKDNRDER